VEAEPGIGAEAEEHLFAMGVRGTEKATLDGAGEEGGGGFAKDTFLGMEMNGDNFLTEAKIPFLAKEFHFGEFGHRRENGGLN
jgi:hypothetical protein